MSLEKARVEIFEVVEFLQRIKSARESKAKTITFLNAEVDYVLEKIKLVESRIMKGDGQ